MSWRLNPETLAQNGGNGAEMSRIHVHASMIPWIEWIERQVHNFIKAKDIHSGHVSIWWDLLQHINHDKPKLVAIDFALSMSVKHIKSNPAEVQNMEI